MEACFTARKQSTFNFAVLVLAYVVYLLVGAGVFSAIELPYEVELRAELEASQRDFIRNNTCVSEDDLQALLARALEANNYGVSVLGGSSQRNWDFMSSLFFTSTVLTTTGYGHTVPLSDEGKAFCMFYAILGIPVTLFLLSAMVQRIMILVTRRPLSYFPRRWAVSKSRFAVGHAALLAAVVATLVLFIPAWVFWALEKDWNFLESLYFCFISLTTIGLGDYVPGERHDKEDSPHRHVYKLVITAGGCSSDKMLVRVDDDFGDAVVDDIIAYPRISNVHGRVLTPSVSGKSTAALWTAQAQLIFVYLLLGLLLMLVLMETCVELPQMKRLRQRFYQEDIRELDGEAANIMESEHVADNFRPGGIPSVSQQAASMRAGGRQVSYTPASGSSLHGQLS
ncbi:potassium channel subfamily K member 1-like isoform X1 [Nerophis ophidion]|uniref:potassium channel subfamily K member 1-like isoform X1 n=1 Tax=Nerophis ophidion TaxID=159077 RepID=UPI002ADFA252|nr:potassium channel subfamily K member 1-like isoform X1 [Nerophis ophidion]